MPQEQIKVFILGARGAGKTSFLTGLSILSQPNQKSNFLMLPKGEESTKRVEDMRSRVRLGEWAPADNRTTPLEIELTYKKTDFQLSVLDYPGEDMVKAMETMSFTDKENIHQHLIEADCILLLLDPTQDLISELNDDSESETERRQTALATAINYSLSQRMEENPDANKPRIYPIVTKKDLFRSKAEEKKLAKANDNLLKRLRDCARDPKKIQINPITACGDLSPDNEGFPAKPSPDGFDSLFETISTDCHKKRTVKMRLIRNSIFILVALILVSIITTNVLSACAEAEIIEKGRVEVILEIQNPDGKLIDQRLEKEIDSFNLIISNPNANLDQLQKERGELAQWQDVQNHKYNKELGELSEQFDARIGDGLLSKAQGAMDAGNVDATLEACNEYLETYPNGMHRERIGKIRDDLIKVKHRRYLQPIRSVTASSKSKVESKVYKIEEYRQKFPNLGGRDVEAVERAIATARALTQANSAKIAFRSMYFNSGKRDVSLRLYTNPPGKKIEQGKFIYKSKDEVNRATFSKDLRIKQSEWDDFEVCLWDLEWIDEIMARSRSSLYRALPAFDGKTNIKLEKVKGDPSANGGYKARIKLYSGKRWEPLSSSQIQAYQDYIYPGKKW